MRHDNFIIYNTILEPKYRQKLFDKIYNSLNWGGAFVMFEKIRKRCWFQDILTFLYFDFK